MRTRHVAAAVAICLLGIGSVSIIADATTPELPPVPWTIAEPARPEPPPRQQPTPVVPPPVTALVSSAPATPRGPPGTGPDPWESVPPLPRAWPALTYAIAQAQPRLRACFDRGSQQRFARQGYTSTRRQQVDDHGTAVLMLQLDALPGGQLRIEDAPVDKRGNASEALLACAQDALRGVTLAIPAPSSGTRLRARYPLR
jgi:hypothetical protein